MPPVATSPSRPSLSRDQRTFQQVCHFLAALAHGAENNLGKGTNSICNLAGKKFGAEAVAGVEQTSDPLRALEILNRALEREGIFWEIEPFAGERGSPLEEDGASRKMRLVFRTCMVRNALFCYAHEQKLSLCHMAHGVFSGAMEKAMPGCTVDLHILQACPNACLKEMIWTVKP